VGVIHLGRGHPSSTLLPDALLRATLATLDPARSLAALQYRGAALDTDFRTALAAFLTDRYRHPVTPAEVLPTSGISLTLGMVCQVFAPAGATVVCSDPTYFHATSVLHTAGMKLHPVPVDGEGMVVDALEDALRAGLRPALVYCIPAFHNPAGVCLSPARAEKLVDLAVAYDFRVVADEPYTLLHFGPTPPPCLMAFDQGRGRVIGLGSFSKLLAPGLRVGWLHAHPALIEAFCTHGTLRSGGGLNPWMAAAVTTLMENGALSDNVDHLRATLSARMHALTDALRSQLPDCTFHTPEGGYFLWASLPGPVVEGAGVTFLSGQRCSPAGGCGDRARLSVSLYDAEVLQEGIARLARSYRISRTSSEQ
jgi:2-aminoadipate transaminase